MSIQVLAKGQFANSCPVTGLSARLVPGPTPATLTSQCCLWKAPHAFVWLLGRVEKVVARL